MADAYIPYGAYWSTPFAKWQGTLSHLNSVELAAHVTKEELFRRDIDAAAFDTAILGISVPQHHSFFGAPWLTGMLGADRLTGPTIAQACATSARCLQTAHQEVADGTSEAVLLVTCDRTSNGPSLYYPNPAGPGGTGTSENWVLDNFNHDPYAGNAMIATAENVARKWQIATGEQHDVVARRYQQYTEAVADDHAFHKRYMHLPFDVPDARFRKTVGQMAGDEGIYETTRDGLDRLKPVLADGTVTFGGQTHPADGNTGMIATTREKAREMAVEPGIEIRLAGFGQARTDKGYMPHAPVPAARRALDDAGIGLDGLAAIKTHNPFAVNDIVFCRETGWDVDAMNNYGCSLIWGHPQGPTGLRAVCELIEELAIRGGGYGLFAGCAAGDSAMAVVVEVTDARR